ncbi:transmembrane protein 26-like isoform X2 [Melanotaenia boesemani]|uniref:transmembrane protein 26-like isoform X2 n=1 Tax=Melanotaenia boesemani TaxID=1250792 RepID=UPI001C05E118|nr:transmembrane protein 26-like isoform X2 [Melanotaenia boesemani]
MLFKFISAVVTRAVFILVSLIGVWRVVWVKNNGHYWLLTILYLPLVAEMILTLRRKKGNDYKWFSPAVFLFLISIIPSIWILEIHHQENKSADSRCNKLDSSENFERLFKLRSNSTSVMERLEVPLTTVCANDWILALHQILLILLILGKWLLPATGELTRDQLSQLLLIFVGTAADILEFTSETISDISSPAMVYVILSVWTWSMLQFPLHLSVMDSSSEDQPEPAPSRPCHLRADIWSIMEALLIQDGPFLVVRLVVMIRFKVVHQMLIFFVIKNFLVVVLNVYRLQVLSCDTSSSDGL